MKVAELVTQRRKNWQELEQLCAQMENRRKKTLGAKNISRFASLYRSTCADLALADAYQLPPNTVQYLHRLVGRSHNQLYRSRRFDIQAWADILLHEVPKKIFSDRCVQTAFAVFWFVFLASAGMAMRSDVWPTYANQMVGDEMLEQMDESFAKPIKGRAASNNPVMASFYIKHNTSIGLQCFAGGLLLIPGLVVTVFNAAHLGAAFGYFARPDVAAGNNFFEFVTAHGPFELTAIVLSAGAGMRLGMGWIKTEGYGRIASLRRTAKETMPVMGAAIVLFFLAALIEGFLSPSALPYGIKAAVAVISSGLLMVYFVVLGFPSDHKAADSENSGSVSFDQL